MATFPTIDLFFYIFFIILTLSVLYCKLCSCYSPFQNPMRPAPQQQPPPASTLISSISYPLNNSREYVVEISTISITDNRPNVNSDLTTSSDVPGNRTEEIEMSQANSDPPPSYDDAVTTFKELAIPSDPPSYKETV